MPALEYTLGLKTADFDRGIKNATSETKVFSQSMTGMQVAGESATRHLNGGFHELREGAHGAKEGMQALTGVTELLGYQVAPEATIAVRTLYETIKALGAASRISGLGVGGLTVAIVGLAAALAILAAGYQVVDAELEELKSADALDQQYDTLKERLIPQLEKYIKLGRIDPKIGQGAINFLNGASEENKAKAIKNAQDILRPEIKADKQYAIGQQLDKLLNGERLSLLPDKEREKQEFLIGQDEKFRAALDLAKKSGRDEKPIVDLFNAANQAGLNKIDEKYADKTKEPGLGLEQFHESAHTALERIGLVYKGGVGSDPQTQTARNTARMAASLDKIVQHVARSGGGNFGDSLINSPAI